MLLIIIIIIIIFKKNNNKKKVTKNKIYKIITYINYILLIIHFVLILSISFLLLKSYKF